MVCRQSAFVMHKFFASTSSKMHRSGKGAPSSSLLLKKSNIIIHDFVMDSSESLIQMVCYSVTIAELRRQSQVTLQHTPYTITKIIKVIKSGLKTTMYRNRDNVTGESSSSKLLTPVGFKAVGCVLHKQHKSHSTNCMRQGFHTPITDFIYITQINCNWGLVKFATLVFSLVTHDG